jgi:hypothetical protein
MKELFDLSFSPANVFPTILLLFVALYWLVFLFGMLDLSFMDFEVDAGAEVDANVDVGMDHDVHVEHDVSVEHDAEIGKEIGKDMAKDISGQGQTTSGGLRILHFLNLGDVPFMIFFSFFALFYWAMSILGNHYLAEGRTLLVAGILAGSFVLALLMAKLFTQPMRKMFREMGKGDAPVNLIGKLCTLELGVEGTRMGQAVVIVGDKHLLVSVRSEDGEKIPSGVRCLIVEREENLDAYLVSRFEIEESIT